MSRFWQMAEHVVVVLGALGTGARWWLHKHDRSVKQEVFIEEVRSNHLPHIYRALRAICTKLGINMEELDG